jgi:hypothetical protein
VRWAVCIGAVLVAFLPAAGRTTPVQLTIVQHGHFPIPPRGTFESGSPFCSSGTWQDSDANDRIVGTKVYFDRIHTCDDGSGTIVVSSTTFDHFHNQGSSWTGSGKIVSGTGKYVHLRGLGTISGVEHDQTNFTDTWQGRAGFDDVAPSAAIRKVSVRARRKPKGAFMLTARFTSRDNVPENVVSYELALSAAGKPLASRKGRVSTGAASVTFSVVKPPKTARRLQLSLTVSDELDNHRTTGKAVALPH